MTMLCRGPSGTTHGGYRVAGLHTVSHADQILGIVAVTSLQPVGMTYYHHVPVCGILSGEADYPVEHRPYLVARLRFQVRSRMVLACPAIGTDHLGTGQRITPLPYPGQVYRERRSLVEQPGVATPTCCRSMAEKGRSKSTSSGTRNQSKRGGRSTISPLRQKEART